MRRMLNLAIAALVAISVVYAQPAKPKTAVSIKVEDSFDRLKGASNLGAAVGGTVVSFVNATISAVDDPTVHFQNGGQWCFRSEEGQVQLAKDGKYSGTWDGNFLHLQIPQKKGKPLDVAFSVYDHQWRNIGSLPAQ
jgi:hypothetical protein